MKIVHCIWAFNTGGAETMLIDIANEQVKEHEVHVIVVNDSYEQQLVDAFSEKNHLVFIKRKLNSSSIIPFIRLNYILWKIHPDVIHVHNASLPRVIHSRARHGLFMTVHALHFPLENARHGVRLIAISDAVREDVISRGDYDVTTVPNGINIGAVVPRASWQAVKNRPFRIVQVARLDADKKGQDILIRAIALLKNNGGYGVNVDFIGVGPSEDFLRSLAKDLGVAHHVNFLGLRDRAYIYSHLKDYDLMCHPSRYEGFGLTVAEGVAAKLPVLVANEGGPYEIIKEGELGYVFQSGSAEACAAQIKYIMDNYEEALEKTENAFLHVEENYSLQHMVRKYIEVYQSK